MKFKKNDLVKIKSDERVGKVTKVGRNQVIVRFGSGRFDWGAYDVDEIEKSDIDKDEKNICEIKYVCSIGNQKVCDGYKKRGDSSYCEKFEYGWCKDEEEQKKAIEREFKKNNEVKK